MRFFVLCRKFNCIGVVLSSSEVDCPRVLVLDDVCYARVFFATFIPIRKQHRDVYVVGIPNQFYAAAGHYALFFERFDHLCVSVVHCRLDNDHRDRQSLARFLKGRRRRVFFQQKNNARRIDDAPRYLLALLKVGDTIDLNDHRLFTVRCCPRLFLPFHNCNFTVILTKVKAPIFHPLRQHAQMALIGTKPNRRIG